MVSKVSKLGMWELRRVKMEELKQNIIENIQNSKLEMNDIHTVFNELNKLVKEQYRAYLFHKRNILKLGKEFEKFKTIFEK
jgi:hypothetical protein